jgi:hypothetical protein
VAAAALCGSSEQAKPPVTWAKRAQVEDGILAREMFPVVHPILLLVGTSSPNFNVFLDV